MSTPKRDALVEVVLNAKRDRAFAREWTQTKLSEEAYRGYWRGVLSDCIADALAPTEECGECRGSGWLSTPALAGDELATDVLTHRSPCPTCKGTKTVPGKPLIIEAAVEAGIDVVGALVKLGVLQVAEREWTHESNVTKYIATPTGS